MKTKAFFSDPSRIVDHMCSSLVHQNPSLRYDSTNKGELSQATNGPPHINPNFLV